MKLAYNYDSLSQDQRSDFDEEVKSLIPLIVDNTLTARYSQFELLAKKNLSHSVFWKKLNNAFAESAPLFIFLNMLTSFNITSTHNFSSTLESENHEIYSIANSFIDSQFIFWRNVEIFQNFLITTKTNLSCKLLSKVNILVQTCLKIMCDLSILEERKNYIKIRKHFKKEEYFNKSVISYRPLIILKTGTCFNVENKFFKAPLQIIEYDYPLEKEKKISEKEHLKFEEMQKRSIVTGPSYIRAEVHNKINPHGLGSFLIKAENLSKIYSETKFYPDLAFISHVKETFYSHLNIAEIEDNLLKIRHELEDTFKETNWQENILSKRVELQKKYSKLLENKKIFIFLNHNWEEYYHLASSNDHRGRKYYCSPLTFTHFKLSRFCFHYGYKGVLQQSFFDWTAYKNLFSQLSKDANSNFDNDHKEIIGFYLIGLGKVWEVRKSKIETSLIEILEAGIQFFLAKNNLLHEKLSLNWESLSLKEQIDCIEHECYRFGLRKFLEGDLTERIILKDATASGYQIQAYILGVKSYNKLKYLNLGEDPIFVDTYLFIINAFETSLSNKALLIKHRKYFQRSIIKKFCMIIPYSAGFEKCFSSISPFVTKDNIDEVGSIFLMFYNFVKKELWVHLDLKESYSNYIKNYINTNQKYEAESETGYANLQYNKTKIYEHDFKYINRLEKKTRTTRAYMKTTDVVDVKKTLTAFAPNYTHFHDADIIRILHLEPYNLKFASIHDAFVVSSFECGKLVHSYGSIFKIKMRFNYSISATCLM